MVCPPAQVTGTGTWQGGQADTWPPGPRGSEASSSRAAAAAWAAGGGSAARAFLLLPASLSGAGGGGGAYSATAGGSGSWQEGEGQAWPQGSAVPQAASHSAAPGWPGQLPKWQAWGGSCAAWRQSAGTAQGCAHCGGCAPPSRPQGTE